MISSERAAAQKAATEIGKKYRNVKLAIQNPAAARPAELRGFNRKQLQDLYKKYGKESKLAKNNLAASGGKLKSDDYLTKLKEIRDNPAKYMVAEKAWKKYGSLAFETAQESGEEYLEEIASQKGLIAGGSKDKIDWWSPEAQMAVALGAIGGVMGKGFMAAIDNRNKKYDVRDFQANINGRIEALESFKRYQEDLSDAYKSGDKRRIEYVTNERVAEMMVESVIGNSTDDIKSYAEEMLSYTKEEAEEAGLVVDPKSDAYYIRHAQKIAHVAEVAKYTFARLKNNADITSFTKPYFVKGRVKYEWAKLDSDYYRGKLMEEGKKAGHTDEQIKIQINKAIANTVERYKADLSDMTGKPDSQTRALYTKSPRYASMLDKAARDLRIKEGLYELNNEQSKDKDVSAAYSESIHDYVAAELEANWMAGHVQGLAEDKYYRDEFEKHAKKEEAKVRSADRIINKAESAINTAYTGFKMTVNEDEFGISKNREKTVDVIDPNASDEDVVTETERLIRDGKNVRGAEEISGFITAQLRQFKKLKGKRKEGARERIAALVQSLDEILRNHNKSVKLSYAERIQVIDDAIEDAKENLKKGTRKDAILKALNETREDVLEELNDAVENGLEVEEEYYRYMFQKRDMLLPKDTFSPDNLLSPLNLSSYEKFQILGDRIASLISKHTDLSTFFGMSRRKQIEFLNEHAEELRKDIDWEPVDGLTKEWEDKAKATLDYLENEGDPVSLISLMALRGSNDFNKYLELKQENESSKRGKKKKKKKGETTEEEDQVEGQEGDEDSITYKDFKALLDQKGID